MSATSVLPARSQIRGLSKEKISAHIDEILQMDTMKDVVEFVEQNFK
jgi:phosphoenolpyruvate-protein phosphotransferase (PTS system enzyme I)